MPDTRRSERRGFWDGTGIPTPLTLPAGRVPVTFEAGGIAWMQPPPVEPGAVLSSQSAAALLGLPRSGGLLVAAYAATTLFDNSFMSLFPAFGLRLGLDEAEISLILSCLLLGGALAQVPIGWIIDRSSVFTALAACSLIGIAGFPLFAALMPAAKPAMAFAFLWGGALLGVQTIALAEMGKCYSGAMLRAGNATLALMWGVSGIVGIPVTGYAMDTLGPYGLPIVVGAVFTVATLAFVAQVFTTHRRTG